MTKLTNYINIANIPINSFVPNVDGTNTFDKSYSIYITRGPYSVYYDYNNKEDYFISPSAPSKLTLEEKKINETPKAALIRASKREIDLED